MTGALSFLPPGIKLYGLSAYALTATFGPNIAASLAAFLTIGMDVLFVGAFALGLTVGAQVAG